MDHDKYCKLDIKDRHLVDIDNEIARYDRAIHRFIDCITEMKKYRSEIEKNVIHPIEKIRMENPERITFKELLEVAKLAEDNKIADIWLGIQEPNQPPEEPNESNELFSYYTITFRVIR